VNRPYGTFGQSTRLAYTSENADVATHALAQYTSDLKNAEAAACSGTSGICSGAPGSTGGDPATVPTCSGAGRLDCVAGQCVFDAPDASTTD
jgi:hypothetical protein